MPSVLGSISLMGSQIDLGENIDRDFCVCDRVLSSMTVFSSTAFLSPTALIRPEEIAPACDPHNSFEKP